jgi:hypothetical protein
MYDIIVTDKLSPGNQVVQGLAKMSVIILVM